MLSSEQLEKLMPLDKLDNYAKGDTYEPHDEVMGLHDESWVTKASYSLYLRKDVEGYMTETAGEVDTSRAPRQSNAVAHTYMLSLESWVMERLEKENPRKSTSDICGSTASSSTDELLGI